MFKCRLSPDDIEWFEGKYGYQIKTIYRSDTTAGLYVVEEKKQKQNLPVNCKNMPYTPKLYLLRMMDFEKVPPVALKFYIREIQLLSIIPPHPHIIKLYEMIRHEKKFIFIQRFAERGTLLDHIQKHGNANERIARTWIRQLALAVNFLHRMNIAHRGVKAENIFITTNYNIKLSSFAFARFTVNKQCEEEASVTFCGSLVYAPPELFLGLPYKPKIVDYWCVGVILYIILNGVMPFHKSWNAASLWIDMCLRNYSFKKKVTKSVSEKVIDVVDSLLEPAPTKRMTMDELMESAWMRRIRKYRELAPSEAEALHAAEWTVKTCRKKCHKGLGEDYVFEPQPFAYKLMNLGKLKAKSELKEGSNENLSLKYEDYD